MVGVSLVISFQCGSYASHSSYYKTQIKRVLGSIAIVALIITAITWFTIPNMYVSFGILHHIAVGIIIALPLVTHPLMARLALLLTITASYLVSLLTSKSVLLHILGANYQGYFQSMDFIPLLPWFVAMVMGIVGAQLWIESGLFKRINKAAAGFTVTQWLAVPGRYSLRIYVAHVPILVIIFVAVGWIDFYRLFPGLR